jgi:hypothetical protein
LFNQVDLTPGKQGGQQGVLGGGIHGASWRYDGAKKTHTRERDIQIEWKGGKS